MDTKSLVFVVISSLLVAGIYSSSTYFVFAAVVCANAKGTGGTVKFCYRTDPTDNNVYRCEKGKNGKWTCAPTVTREGGGSNIVSPDLKNAIDKAYAGYTKGGNN
ncbi:MAG: hypothetical protein E6L01_08085, partial [Thaumarchaeota archaeon]